MIADNYYDVLLEYKEDQGSAHIKLFWSSLSLQNQIVPRAWLNSPEYVGSSPYRVVVDAGPSVASECTATGDGLSTATAGKIAEIDIVSRGLCVESCREDA
jgi:hypothetical protein